MRLPFSEDGMRMLVLGAGLQGSACAYDLLQNPAVERVRLADVRSDPLPPFLQPYTRDPRLERAVVDARDEASVRRAMQQMQACLNALPYYFNLEITRLAIDAGLHCCDLGGNTEIVFRQLELDSQARDRGVSVIPDCGVAPGMVNILAEAGLQAVGEATRARIYVGGLPQHPMPPLGYQIVYSLEGVLDYYTTPCWVVRNGRRTTVEALTEVERVEFPDPPGPLEAFHTAGGLSTMAFTHEGRVQTMEYKTLRYPGHAEKMRTIRDLGLLSNEPLRVKGQQVVPRDVFVACAEPRLKRPNARDLVALRVEVEGRQNGQAARVRYELLDFFDEERGISAMERCTGYSLSITGQLQVGARTGAGVRTPDQAIPAQAYIDAMAERGVVISSRME
jgi:lysine 6-dehydrogenase